MASAFKSPTDVVPEPPGPPGLVMMVSPRIVFADYSWEGDHGDVDLDGGGEV